MTLNVADWKRFRMGCLFDIKKGKRLTSDEQTEGDNIYIGAIDNNNGVANRIGQKPIHKGNTISLSYNGSVGEAFYQPEDYWATDDVNALYSKYDGFNEQVGLFIATIIRQEKYRFSYGHKWTLENMVDTEIALPVKHNLDGSVFIDETHTYSEDGYVPDWQFMEDYMKSLHHKPLTTENTNSSIPVLNCQNWKAFRVGDFFDIHPTKFIDGVSADDCVGYGVPLVVNSAENNGVAGFCDMKPTEEGNIITFSDTIEGNTFFYQPEPFIGFAHIQGMYPKTRQWSKEELLFFTTIMMFDSVGKYSYGRKMRRDIISEIKVKLPPDENGNPDWQFMEDYIKSLPYGDRI